jgi:hypothetical protein
MHYPKGELKKWWKKEMIVSLALFAFIVLCLVFVRFNIKNAPFTPLVILFFTCFVVLFLVAFFVGKMKFGER